MTHSHETAVVFLLGYPGMGKRTVGGALATLIDAVLLDNARIHGVLLEPFRWDGVAPLPAEIWDRVTPIRQALLGVIEDLAPASNSYVFTNALPDRPSSVEHYDSIRSLAARRGSLFLAVQLDCDIDAQVSRIDNPDRIALRKGADPAGYRWHRENVKLFEPPTEDRFDIDTTNTSPEENAELIRAELVRRGFTAPGGWNELHPDAPLRCAERWCSWRGDLAAESSHAAGRCGEGSVADGGGGCR